MPDPNDKPPVNVSIPTLKKVAVPPPAEAAVSTQAPILSGWKSKLAHDDDDGKGGTERWLLSYADFITLLMVLFMMLYGLQLVKNKDVAISSLRSEDHAAQHSAAASQATPDSKAAGLETDLKALRDGGQIKLNRTANGVEIAVNARLLFASGEAKLLPESLPVLKMIAKSLERARNHILVEGHTDSIPISNGKFESNWELSSARAGAVVRYLVDHGIEPTRLAAMGRADNVPAVIGNTPEAYAANRRVTILVQY
jgi:chemotaxis protein MotB